jgi:hypothetical protein
MMFADRICYPHHRRFLSSKNSKRRIGVKNGEIHHILEYIKKDNHHVPIKKTYEQYRHRGKVAERKKKNYKGVRGIWKLDALPYAEDIGKTKDPMHSMTNVIEGCIKAIRPTKGSFKNRTETIKVRKACCESGIFKKLMKKVNVGSSKGQKKKKFQKAPWTLEISEIEKVHKKLKRMNAPPRVQTPFVHNGGATSHDTILFATQYAHEVFEGINTGSPHIMENMLDIFGVISHLCQYKFHPEHGVKKMSIYLKNLLSDREGLFPPCESTYPFHELVHVVEQILELGPPMMCSLFKYERKNRWLKGLIKNKRSPLSSLMKNYLISESCNMIHGLNIDCYNRMTELFKLSPPSVRENISKTIKAIKRLGFDPIQKTITCDPEEIDNDTTSHDDTGIIEFLCDGKCR